MSGLPLTIAVAQINPIVGDIEGNFEKLLFAHAQGSALGAQLVVAPELSVLGYPPEDLIHMPAFRQRAMAAVNELATKTKDGAAFIVGCVWEEGGNAYNAAVLLDGGKIAQVQYKSALPNYGVFDEKRIFVAGNGPKAVTCRGVKLGILVCEDVWVEANAQSLKDQGAQLLVAINASPFEAGKLALRKRSVARAGLPLVYVNAVGGQDDIVFDGGSFFMQEDGSVIAHLPEFSEQISLLAPNTYTPFSQQETLWQAMSVGLRDYVRKNGFSSVLLGISGGIDSALTAALAVDALGAKRVRGVLLPSPYTSPESNEDALALAANLGIEAQSICITPMMETYKAALDPAFARWSTAESQWMEDPSTGGNLQARIRGQVLMALSNKTGAMLLTTGNKSEIAVGYSTLYGDSCGGYNVLKDLYKTQVFALATWRNTKGAAIPERSITKPPSAELKPGQKDEDQLPPYAVLDAILQHHLEGQLEARQIINKGFDAAVVSKVLRLVRINEYKRRQSAPGVKLSPMLFGRDRRYPLTNRSDA